MLIDGRAGATTAPAFPDVSRFWSHAATGGKDECWSWKSAKDRDGYGKFKALGKDWRAHRWIYEVCVDEIPKGYVIHHECGNKSCVNPGHLSPMPRSSHCVKHAPTATALSKSNAAKTHCPQGHEYTPENTYSWPGANTRWRACRACHKLRSRNIEWH